MALGDQINFRPEFKTKKVPCTGRLGDFIIITELDEHEADPKPIGSPQFYFCVKERTGEGRPAVWARLKFDGWATCETAVLAPAPQDIPELERG